MRDPIHIFVRLTSDERRVLDSTPFQRLRHIHQLALSYLVYPGAAHKRFEHSLGVMELATRIFDVVTDPDNVSDEIRELLPAVHTRQSREYWRSVVRMAALCHDLGHLPFSHAAERDLLPAGWDHERITVEIINSPEMTAIWQGMVPPLRPDHIAKIAVGPKAADGQFSDWEAILSEIIIGDAFGADRIDYLLRDSYHAGVAYGRFDHYRLVDTLRILPPAPQATTQSEQIDIAFEEELQTERSEEPTLGVQHGGLHSAEALLIARYFMYTQVYLHPVRRAYDRHLVEFLKAWLPEGKFPTDVAGHLSRTDLEVTAAMRALARGTHPASRPAHRILERKHYRVLYQSTPEDIVLRPDAAAAVHAAAVRKFGPENLILDQYQGKSAAPDLPVWSETDRKSFSAHSLSQPLRNVPPTVVDFVYVAPELKKTAAAWLRRSRRQILDGKWAFEGKHTS
ncbi:MAG TPA: HD domain-containing protein [Longimicrobium sp.]